MNIHDSQNSREEVRGYLFNTSLGTNVFRQTIYGVVILNGRANIRSCQGWRGFSEMINVFPSSLNTVNGLFQKKIQTRELRI